MIFPDHHKRIRLGRARPKYLNNKIYIRTTAIDSSETLSWRIIPVAEDGSRARLPPLLPTCYGYMYFRYAATFGVGARLI